MKEATFWIITGIAIGLAIHLIVKYLI